MFQHVVNAHACEGRRFWRAKPQHLADHRIDARQFPRDDFGEFLFLALLHQQFDERFDRREAIFDFVRDARRKRSEIGELIQSLEILL